MTKSTLLAAKFMAHPVQSCRQDIIGMELRGYSEGWNYPVAGSCIGGNA